MDVVSDLVVHGYPRAESAREAVGLLERQEAERGTTSRSIEVNQLIDLLLNERFKWGVSDGN